MLSWTSEYALRAVLVLAREREGRTIPADEIARATGAPRNYLAKTLNALARAGIVTSARGPKGGFALAIPAHILTLSRIIECFDEPRVHVRCLLGARPCDPVHPCAAHGRWAAFTGSRRAPMETTTVAELLSGRAIADPELVRSPTDCPVLVRRR